MKPNRNLVEPPVASRQAKIRKEFQAVSDPPYPKGGRKPVNCAFVHLRLPDVKTQKAVIKAAQASNVSVNNWLVAATSLALAQLGHLPLPEKPVKRNVIAEAIRAERERQAKAARKERLRMIDALRKEGLSEATIARVLGLSPSAFCHFLKKYGTQRGRMFDARFTKALEMVDSGMQLSEVARCLGTSTSAIQYHLRKRG